MQVKGLIYLPQFITKEQEKQLIVYLLEQEWNTSLKRRTQHYGYTYSYDRKNTLQIAKPIPGLLYIARKQIQAYIKEHLDNSYQFDQIIINQYVPGQGISPHIDNPKIFDGIIVSLSLSSDTIMTFENDEGKKIDKLLQRRSLLILTGDSRYKWKHSIPSRKSDHGIQRKNRISLTLRRVVKELKKQQKQ